MPHPSFQKAKSISESPVGQDAACAKRKERKFEIFLKKILIDSRAHHLESHPLTSMTRTGPSVRDDELKSSAARTLTMSTLLSQLLNPPS